MRATRTVIGIAISLAYVAALAQGPGNVSVSFDDVPIRQALDRLFAGAGLSYQLDPSTQGNVTAQLSDVPFETALRIILRQVRLIYRVEGGVYVIEPQPVEPPPAERHRRYSYTPPEGERVVKIRVRNVPASLVLMRLLGRNTSTVFGPFAGGPQPALFWSSMTQAFWGASQYPFFLTTGTFLPVWIGSGWESQLAGGTPYGGGPAGGPGGGPYGGGPGR